MLRDRTFTARSLTFLLFLFVGASLLCALSPCAATQAWISIRLDVDGGEYGNLTGLRGAYDVPITPDVLSSSGILSPAIDRGAHPHYNRQDGERSFDNRSTPDWLKDFSGTTNPAINAAILVNPRLLLASLNEPAADIDLVAVDDIVAVATRRPRSRLNVAINPRSITFTAGNALSKDEWLRDTCAIAVVSRTTMPFDILSVIGVADWPSAESTVRQKVRPMPARKTLAVAGVGVF